MSDLLHHLSGHTLLLATGMTALLAFGCGCVALTPSPVHRQRLGELSLCAVLAWLILALAPLPRWLPDPFMAGLQPPEADSRAAPTIVSATPVWPELVSPAEPEPDFSMTPAEVADGLAGMPFVKPTPPALPIDEAVLPLAGLPEIPPPSASHAASQIIANLWASGPAVLLAVFMVGAGGCAAWLCVGHALLRSMCRSADATEPWLNDLLSTLSAKARIAAPRLIVSRRCARPLSWGALRPVVMLPRSLCRRENQAQLTTVLLHELGHIAQKDAWSNCLLCLAFPCLYWHPLYWWLRSRMRLAAELVADDWAAGQTGKEAYVEELVALAKTTVAGGLPLLGVTGIFSSPSQFYRRMQMLLSRETPLATRPSALWRLASLSLFGLAVVLATLSAGVRSAPGQLADEKAAPAAAEPAPAALPAVTTPPAAPPRVPAPPLTELPDPKALEPARATPGAENPPPATTVPRGAESAQIQALMAERAKLQAMIRDLQDRLNAADSHEKVPSTILKQRVRENVTSTEKWATDELGRPKKLVERTETEKFATPPPPVEVISYPLGISTTPYAVPAAGAKAVPAVAAPGYPQPPLSRTPSAAGPAELPASSDGAVRWTKERPVEDVRATGGSSKQLDLVSLATSYADAIGAVDLAKAKVAEYDSLAKSNAVAQHELTAARLALQNAHRKEQLLRRIAEVTLDGTKRELENAARLVKLGFAPASSQSEAQARLEILEQILGAPARSDGKVEKVSN